MEVIERTISHRRPDIFSIYPLGCIHAGAVDCAENDVKRIVKKIEEDKNAYWIGMGDMADCILKEDKRFDISGLASWVKKDNIVESQRIWIRDTFKPIAGKCLAFLEGNHEEKIHRNYQNDLTRNLCEDLKVPYGGYSCYLNIKFVRAQNDRTNFLFHCFHGAGASQTEGARIMRLMRLVNEIEADIYLMGHLHCMAQYTPDRLKLYQGRIKSTKLAAVITGSWLKTYAQPREGQQLNASYGERAGYKPSRIGCPVIYLDPDANKFTIES